MEAVPVTFTVPSSQQSLASLRGSAALSTPGVEAVFAPPTQETSISQVAGNLLASGAIAVAAACSAVAGRRRRLHRCRFSARGAEGDAEGEPPLESDLGLDYSKLRNLLKEKDFKAADQETRDMLIKMSGEAAIKRGWIYWAEVKRIPEADMNTLESLWQHFSQGKFGFVAQRKIWRQCRGQFDKFALKVDWFTDTWKNRNWPDEFVYDLDAAVGHLPLTNCIRGAQVLEELLLHPVIQTKKAAVTPPPSKPVEVKAPTVEEIKIDASEAKTEAEAPKKRKSALSMLGFGGVSKDLAVGASAFAGASRFLTQLRGNSQVRYVSNASAPEAVTVEASEAAKPNAEAPVITPLAEIKECNVIDMNGFVLPEVPEGSAASIFVIYDATHQAQYLGFSKDLRNTLRTMLCRRPELCYHYKCASLQAADNARLLEIRTAWIKELGELPVGNANPRQKNFWESPVDGGALSERAYRKVADQRAKQILQQLKDRGIKESIEFKVDLLDQGKVDPIPSEMDTATLETLSSVMSSKTRSVEMEVLGGKQTAFEIFYETEFDTGSGRWFDVEITAEKMKSTHRIIIGKELMQALGAESFEEVAEKAFAFMIAKRIPRKTDGLITSKVFPSNYFTVSNLATQFPDFLTLFDKISPDYNWHTMQWGFKQVHDYSQDDKRTIPAGPNGGYFDPAAFQ